MNQHPRRLKPAVSLKERLVERVRRYAEANLLPDAEGESHLQETQHPHATTHMNQFRRSLGLKPPE